MSFVTWLQGRLNIHGASPQLVEDGAIGPATTGALKAFQQKHGLPVNGLADRATIVELRQYPGPMAGEVSVPAQTMPPWLAEMTRRMGLHEVRNRTSLMDWLRGGLLPRRSVEAAMVRRCGGDVCRSDPRDEPLPANPFWAQAWATWGVGTTPRVGAVGVIRWSARSGHVGLVAAVDRKRGRIKLRGGNQGDMIKDSWFPAGKFIAFRWPKTYPMTDFAAIDGAASAETYAGTR